MWKPIPNFEGRYEINENAEIRRVWDDSYALLKKRVFRGRHQVALRYADGRQTTVVVSTLMCNTFMRPKAKDEVRVHKDGNRLNDKLSNLTYMKRSEFLKTTPKGSRRKAVAKVSASGELIKVYPSIRAAASENFLTPTGVQYRCNVPRPKPINGYILRWDNALTY